MKITHLNKRQKIQTVKQKDKVEEKSEITPEQKILELEDKLARTFAEMEIKDEGMKKKKKMLMNMEGLPLLKKLYL